MTGIISVSIFFVAGAYSHVCFIKKSQQHAGIKRLSFFVVAVVTAMYVI